MIKVMILCAPLFAMLCSGGEVRPPDNHAALVNPGMGWVLHHYDNSLTKYGSKLAPEDTVDEFPGVSVVYLRLAWAYIEPEEGKFNWAIVDTPAQRWIAKGKQVALRFSCSETGIDYATPRWVEKAGAKGYHFTPGKGVDPNGKLWEPDFQDPVFLAKLENFLKAAAARYDGSPEVAFIDVASFGVWGEGHMFWSTKRNYDAATVIRHMEIHAAQFKKTLLAANDDFANHGRGIATLERARELGLTLRDDSILVQPPPDSYKSAAKADAFWRRLPVILESEHYGPSVQRKAWGDGSLYLKAVEEYHASYASVHWWPREFLAEMRPLIDRINQRLGYRIRLTEAVWPERAEAGRQFNVTWAWTNAGVAPCLPGGFPALTLKNAQGGIVAVHADEGFDARSLAPDAPPARRTANFRVPENAPPGVYDVYVSLGTRTGTPRIALPMEGHDGQRRYRVGRIEIAEPRPTVGQSQSPPREN